jgi:hypothetical protein
LHNAESESIHGRSPKAHALGAHCIHISRCPR